MWLSDIKQMSPGWRWSSVAEHLLSMCEDLGSTPTPAHTKENTKKNPDEAGCQRLMPVILAS
jgi:hypothetical protein